MIFCYKFDLYVSESLSLKTILLYSPLQVYNLVGSLCHSLLLTLPTLMKERRGRFPTICKIMPKER
jgi:hypothetical protein